MALSAAAPAALANDYYIDDGDITVTVKDNGDTCVSVGNAQEEKDDTAVVIKGGKNPNKQTENNADGSAADDTADEAQSSRRACGEDRHGARCLAREREQRGSPEKGRACG